MPYTEEQQAIINHRDGPAYVVAGAGTGKTHTMTARVQHLIEDGVNPSEILVLTFTNAAAREMKNRLKGSVGKATEEVMACTYHSFCNSIMRRTGIPSKDFTILQTGEEEDLLRLIKSQSVFAHLTKLRASTLLELWSEHINCNIPYEQLYRKEKYEHLYEFKEQVEALHELLIAHKREHNQVDFDDMLVTTVQVLRSPRGKDIKNQYRYVMVDEAQDTNFIQFVLTGYLSRNIMYIGDPEQSIYGFRGSNLDLYLSVPNRFSGCQIYPLSLNYRCTQQILDVANSVIEHDAIPYKAMLKTGKDYYGAKPFLIHAKNQDEEAQDVIRRICGTPKGETFAVIYRSSFSAARVETELVKQGVDYKKMGGIKFFERDCIRDMMAYCKVLVNPSDYLSWFRILQNNRRIGEVRANQMIADAEHSISNLLQENRFRTQTTKTAAEINRQLDSLGSLLIKAADTAFPEQVRILQDYYLDLQEKNLSFLKENSRRVSEKTIEQEERKLEQAKREVPILTTLMQDYKGIGDFLDSVALDTGDIPHKVQAIGQKNEEIAGEELPEITLTTIHSAKGLEWDHVVILDAAQGMFPKGDVYDYDPQKEPPERAEERRCMYVAITRARKECIVYSPKKCFQYGRYAGGDVSAFLQEAAKKKQFTHVYDLAPKENRQNRAAG